MPDRIVLGFDTSAAHCAAALLRGEAILAERVEPMAKGQAERLMPMIETLLAEAGLGYADLGAIGVGVGPGNFTGIRVAVAAARGLALALGVPAVGVSATEAAAFGLPRPCRVALEGRGGALIWEDFPVCERGGPDEASRGSRPQQAADGVLPPGPAPAAPAVPLAVAVARIAAARAHLPDLPRPAPLYLRPADAAPPREAAPLILP
ncbi:tRNA (adenosine(37)-N6)-threonylcarbamoyltransferase complex dimerization subunit type 1 TsaB [Paracoccus tibetensis]|uniref:tRNA threonylcarbamoyl adenosine modification protein YeaZ n=1 Tax=Paracoccus tibetensis TaxID=336292 RepID=A0A1G5IZ54_9RHOB|nr:tRNA (adenosine(37)-N6)-threonylcarbamoyltransferase complex dimerization subunit type 1 TsaB [Paracoccus tibetensis]SCY81356.1 tRNA threonylcarbamoyl adenosine modification protein YeaZ [Paracoccus tibetensis]